MTSMPFDFAAQTKTASDQILALVTQSQQVALAGLKSVASLSAPLLEKLPSTPLALDSSDVKGVFDQMFATAASLVEANKQFTNELFEAVSPARR